MFSQQNILIKNYIKLLLETLETNNTTNTQNIS